MHSRDSVQQTLDVDIDHAIPLVSASIAEPVQSPSVRHLLISTINATVGCPHGT